MFSIDDLYVLVETKIILHNVSLKIESGSVHALMGPNGSGKSSLAYTIAGHPKYRINKGTIFFDGKDILKTAVDERARNGLFVSFQQVPAIPGLTVFSFLKEAYRALSKDMIDSSNFRLLLQEKCKTLAIKSSFLERSLYSDFSGGEKKRLELLQLLLLNPKVAILDEIDSGVDVDSLSIIVKGIQKLRIDNPSIAIVVITHYQHILKHIQPDHVHIMKQGTIIRSGQKVLAQQVAQQGYSII